MALIPRALEPELRKAAKQFPCVVVSGPRQSGKTTLLRSTFPKARYVSLDLPVVAASARSDPRGFLSAHPPPVILDEIQQVPELLSYVKNAVDEQRSRKGQYLLSGSQNLLLHSKVTESLAGRAAILKLFPLSQREIEHRLDVAIPWEKPKRRPRPEAAASFEWERLLRGGYPELVANPKLDAHLWHASYVQTYLERDVRSLRQVGDLAQFQSFVRAIAVRSGGLLNLHDLSRDLGVAVNTAKAWLSVLEASHQVFVLRPFHSNLGKRLVKTPKVYVTDVGMLCHLVGIRDVEHLRHGPMAGAVFETAVLSELLKLAWNRGEEPRVSFYRTSNGVEVDFVVEDGLDLVAIEAKSTATPRPDMAKSIESLRVDLDSRVRRGYVVHAGDYRGPLGESAEALPLVRL